MPRIYDAMNDPADFCADCWIEGRDRVIEEIEAEGETRGYLESDDHPDYAGEDYRCDACGKVLTNNDN